MTLGVGVFAQDYGVDHPMIYFLDKYGTSLYGVATDFAVPISLSPKFPHMYERYETLDKIFEEVFERRLIPLTGSGWRWSLNLEWEGVTEAGKKVIDAIRNHAGKGGLFKIYPHGDILTRWYICLLDDKESDTEKQLHNRYIGFGPMKLRLECLVPVRQIWNAPTNYFFCSATETKYSADEVSFFAAFGTTYGVNDKPAHFNSAGYYTSESYPGVQLAQD